MTADVDRMPPALVRNQFHNKVVHERVVLLTVTTEPIPVVTEENRLQIKELGQGFWRVTLHYGFFEHPNVPRALARCAEHGLAMDMEETTFFLGRETILAGQGTTMAPWRQRLFAFLVAISQRAPGFFQVPPSQVVEMGTQIAL